uniref:tRNA (34-2'-O)-methyltransferase regulator WDR6 n=1 Tax=Caenorhabditis tropicalis TaxID=1561998 RepID=A0A1I7TBG2_9PELO
MDELDNYPLLLDHLIQSEISENLLLDGKIITCAKFDQKYAKNAENRLEEEFPEHIIGCKALESEKKVISVTSRNTLTIRASSSLEIESKIQCDYFATSICSLIIGESLETCHIFFGSVIGDLIDWKPSEQRKPVMRKGHKGMIFSIVTDSTRLFTISDDRTIRMWSISDRESGPIHTVFGHTARPFAISVDIASKLIYTGGIEQTLFCWKYDDSSITLNQKTPLSIGTIRKISQLDKSTLAITSQNGDLLKINLELGKPELSALKDHVMNFAFIHDRLVILTEECELIVYETYQMDRIVFRCSRMKHMMSSDDSAVVWHQNTLIVITEFSVHRLKLSMNVITTICYQTYVILKTIDGLIQIYNFYEPEHVRCLKRFRPKNPSMLPAVFTLVGDILVFGTTHGELFHTDLTDEPEDSELSLSRRDSYELFGGKEVTCIRPIAKKCPLFMALGKTGIWSTLKCVDGGGIEILNSRSFSASSQMAWPSKFIEWNDELLIAGFYGTSLIIWNSTTGLPVFDVYCGGGHRIWKLNHSTHTTFNFDFIRDSELCRQKIDFSAKQYLISTAHSSPIVAASGSQNYLVTVSLDGHLSIANSQGKPIVTIFVGENLLCTDIFEHGEEEVFVLAGGGKSKLSVIRFNPKELQNHNVFWMRHVARPDEGRVVAVKTCKLRSKIFFIASYSSGVIEVFRCTGKPLESMVTLELDDSLGIGSKMDYDEGKLVVGTSGSYLLNYKLKKTGKIGETKRIKLADRSGVTSVTCSHGITYLGCDSGHVYQENDSEITRIHSHLSTVVGIVASEDRIHSVSLDCAILTGSSPASRQSTIVDMPNAMVKTGEGSLAVVGDQIQIINNL